MQCKNPHTHHELERPPRGQGSQQDRVIFIEILVWKCHPNIGSAFSGSASLCMSKSEHLNISIQVLKASECFTSVLLWFTKKRKRKGKGKHKDWGPSRTGKEKLSPGSGVMFPCSGSDLPGAIKPLVDIVDLYRPPHPGIRGARKVPRTLPKLDRGSNHDTRANVQGDVFVYGKKRANAGARSET